MINMICFLLFQLYSVLFQHKDFEEIEGRLKRREPLLLGSTAAQRLGRRLPVEVVSDPLNDVENDPYDDGSDVQKQLRGHQVYKLS